MTWSDMGQKTWGEVGGNDTASVPVTQDVQERMEQLIAAVDTLTARVAHLEELLSDAVVELT